MKKFKFKINGNEYKVAVDEVEQNVAEVIINGSTYTIEIEKLEKPAAAPARKPAGKVSPISTPAKVVAASAIKSPLPGSILKVLVAAGQTVKRGDLLLTMESMKMENNILAEHDGTIKTVRVQTGQSVMQDDILIDFESVEATPAAPEPEEIIQEHTPVSTPTTGTSKSIKSPLPGNVVKIAVSVGSDVKKGDLLLTLESMKMENAILSEANGPVTKIYVQEGQSVMQDEPLVDIG